MNDPLKVTVVSFGARRALMLRWIDPLTRERRFKSAKTSSRSKFTRVRADLLVFSPDRRSVYQ